MKELNSPETHIYIKAPTPNKNPNKQSDYATTPPKTSIIQSNYSHPTGVVKQVYGIPTFQGTAKVV